MSNTESNKNLSPFFYPPINSKTKGKEKFENTYALKAQIYNDIEKIKKAALDNTRNQTVVNPEITADEDSDTIENPKYIENIKDTETSYSAANDDYKKIVAEAIEESDKTTPEPYQKGEQWFNPISDLIKLYISNMKKTKRGL